jgi:hypothetical protein
MAADLRERVARAIAYTHSGPRVGPVTPSFYKMADAVLAELGLTQAGAEDVALVDDCMSACKNSEWAAWQRIRASLGVSA